jgi:hypothetical protein
MPDSIITIKNAVLNEIALKYERFVELTPSILGAVMVFVLGVILAKLAYKAIMTLSRSERLQRLSRFIGFNHLLEHLRVQHSPAKVIATATKGYLIFLFFIEASRVAGLTEVAEFSSKVIGYVPDLVIAIGIITIGLRFGGWIQTIVSTGLGFMHANTAHVLGLSAKYIILTFAILGALSQLQVAPELVQIMFIGFIAMLTISGGLAFGLGGKDVIKELLEAVKKIELKELKKEAAENRKK